jgi:hypothetical protein
MGNQDEHGPLGHAGNNGHALGLISGDVDSYDERYDAPVNGATRDTL